jgi:hypothetical protein
MREKYGNFVCQLAAKSRAFDQSEESQYHAASDGVQMAARPENTY